MALRHRDRQFAVYNPEGNEVFSDGDIVTLIGSADQLNKIKARCEEGPGAELPPPETGEKEIELPASEIVKDFLKQVPEGLRFSEIRYITKIEGDRATVAVGRGHITKVGKSGKEEAIDIKELKELVIFPTTSSLEKKDGGWYITSFPTPE